MRRVLLGILVAVLAAFFAQTALARTWHSRKGKKLEAEFIRVEGSKAVLKKEKDGQVVEIELDRFADEDRKYLETLRDGKKPSEPTESGFETAPSQKSKTAPSTKKRKGATAFPSQEKFFAFLAILAAVNIPIYLLLGKLMFGDFHDFMECVRFWLTPDIISWFRGEGFDDMFGEMKLGFFFLLCIGAVAGEFYLAAKYVFGWI